MVIQFKNMGSSGMDLIKDSSGVIWITITDSVTSHTMPLSNTDIRNLIATLDFLRNQQPDNINADSFPSTGMATTAGYISVDPAGSKVSTLSGKVYTNHSTVTITEDTPF